MINVADNEKDKETEKASKADSFENFEDEAMENAEEGFEVEEISISESGVPFDTCQIARSVSFSKSDLLEEQSLIISEEERRKRALKEKYLNAVGRKPKNVLYINVFPEDENKATLFFGERRPNIIDRQRKEKWQDEIKRIKPVKVNHARVLYDVRLPVLNEGLLCVRFEQNGYSLATSYRNGGVEVRNPFNGEVLTSLVTVELKDNLPSRALRYHPKDGQKLYVGGATGIVQLFDIETSTNIGNSESLSQICNLDLSVDGNNLVTAGRQSRITIIDPSTFEVKSVRERPPIDETTQSSIDDEYHRLRIYGLKCHPTDPNVFLTGGWDGTVKIWDYRVPRAVLSIRGPWINGDSLDVSGDQILTASWRRENSVQIWDYSSGQLIKQIPVIPKTTSFEGEFLYTAKFFRDTFNNRQVRSDLIAVAGNGFHEVSIIDINTEKVIAFLPSHKGVLGLDTLGKFIAYGGKESLFRVGELVLSQKADSRKPKTNVFQEEYEE